MERLIKFLGVESYQQEISVPSFTEGFMAFRRGLDSYCPYPDNGGVREVSWYAGCSAAKLLEGWIVIMKEGKNPKFGDALENLVDEVFPEEVVGILLEHLEYTQKLLQESPEVEYWEEKVKKLRERVSKISNKGIIP